LSNCKTGRRIRPPTTRGKHEERRSLGGWTVLAALEVEPRIRALVAMGPCGSSNPRPGILPAKLTFVWGRNVPTLFLVAENDTMLPLAGMYELFERTSSPKQLAVLRRSDHMHFLDNVEEEHESVRTTQWPEPLAWIPKEMVPITELCSGDRAQLFVRGLALSHLDAALKGLDEAKRFWAGRELARRGVDAFLAGHE
jgi:hypothetical protein